MRAVTLATVLVALLACHPARPPEHGDRLDGHTFVLRASEGTGLFAGATVYVNFDADTLSYHGICDSMSVAYSLEQDRVIADDLQRVGVKGCSAEQAKQDQWLIAFFSSEPTLAHDGATLTFSRASVRLSFLDLEVADPQRPLIGTVWEVRGLVEGCLVQALSGSALPRITFAADSTWQVRAPCLEGTGRYAIDGDRIHLSDTHYVQTDCIPDAQAAATRDLLDERDRANTRRVGAMLRDGLISYEIATTRLSLMRQDAVQLAAEALEPPP